MVITYALLLWNGTDGYLPLPDGVTGRVRYTKLLDDVAIHPNLDLDLSLTELNTISDADLTARIDSLIDDDEVKDQAEIDLDAVVIPDVDATISAKSKRVTPKGRTVPDPPRGSPP